MRRGMLTVPPAPGISPKPTSGSAKILSGLALIRPANAGSSMPAPIHAPCTCTQVFSVRLAIKLAGLRVRRVRWANAASLACPNSVKSPPAQNEEPLPLINICSTELSAAANCRAVANSSRMADENALCFSGRLRVRVSVSTLSVLAAFCRSTKTTGVCAALFALGG